MHSSVIYKNINLKVFLQSNHPVDSSDTVKSPTDTSRIKNLATVKKTKCTVQQKSNYPVYSLSGAKSPRR